MAVPTIAGWTPNVLNPNAGSTLTIDPTDTPTGVPIATGDWLFVVLTAATSVSGSVATPTVPGGWTTVLPWSTPGTGSMSMGVWAKKRAAGETTYTWSQVAGATSATSTVCFWVSGAADAPTWHMGPWGKRADTGTGTTTVAASINTSTKDELVLVLAGERTVAAETATQVTMSSGSRTSFTHLGNGVDAGDQTLLVGTLTAPTTPGPTPNVTITYPNSHAQNGFAAQIGIPLAGTTSGGTTGDTVPPSAVSNLTASPTHNTCALSWTAATDNVGVTGYQYRVGTGTWSATATGTTKTISGLTPSTSYQFGVRAVDAAGNTGPETTVSAFTASAPAPAPDTTAPSAVTGLEATPGQTTVALTWQAASDDVGVTGYQYRVDSGVWSLPTANTGVTVDSLTPATTYTLSVRAQDAAGNLGPAVQVSTTTLAATTTPTSGTGGSGGSNTAVVNGASGNALIGTATRVVSPGYASVADMLSRPVAYIAHRGGSRVCPEMTLYAYGQAALRGYGALEISLARTSDGVYFGLHDQTLLRTSGVDVDPKTLTWAQVQSYRVLASSVPERKNQPDQPYMRLEELFTLYGKTHVFLVDPKYVSQAYHGELLAKIKELLPDATNRVIAKYYGLTTVWLPTAQAQGFKTWGYFYDTDPEADVQTYAPKYDIVGINYSAPQAWFDGLKAVAPGKPLWGHICQTKADAESAVAKGAKGVMCSGIGVISPGGATVTTPGGGTGTTPDLIDGGTL